MMSVRMILKRANAQIGVPYRLYGRLPGIALDCVGLAGFAALGKKVDNLPIDYSLRGDFAGRIEPYFIRSRFRKQDVTAPVIPGDILLCQIDPRQVHLMVAVPGGFVHGHAGLRRIVMTPAPSPWPILSVWRAGR